MMCPYCGKFLSPTARMCPNCGHEFPLDSGGSGEEFGCAHAFGCLIGLIGIIGSIIMIFFR